MLENATLIEERLADARGIAWDNCHKIYILMDDEQVEQMKECGYDTLITVDKNQANPEVMYRWLDRWWSQSCPLRFIEAVRTDADTPDFGFKRHETATLFETLIEQEV